MTIRAHKLTNINHAADELEHILSAALSRLDQREGHVEETTMGGCYALSTGKQWSQVDQLVIHTQPPRNPHATRTIRPKKTLVSPLTSHRQHPGQLAS